MRGVNSRIDDWEGRRPGSGGQGEEPATPFRNNGRARACGAAALVEYEVILDPGALQMALEYSDEDEEDNQASLEAWGRPC